ENLVTDARGNVTRERRSGSTELEVTRTFEPLTGRLQSIQAGAGGSLQSEVYTWDAAGNLTSRDKPGQYVESFLYDNLHRLTHANLTTPQGGLGNGLTQSYDAFGNICSRTIGTHD